MSRTHRALTVIAAAGVLAALPGLAAADHTDPGEPLSPLSPEIPGDPGITSGEGTWEFIANFPSNPGSDIWFFTKDGVVYSTSGTLGQGPDGFVGQRILRLVDADGTVNPAWVADHGSARCDATPDSLRGTTGLQHDSSVIPFTDPELLVDATDARGRCHDPGGGGIEIIDISGLGEDGFEVREVHLVRFNGLTHTLTVDERRPWLVYSNNSDFAGSNWLDFMDIRSCLTTSAGGTLPDDATLAQKRVQCRPEVYRIPFEDAWTQGTMTEDGEPQEPSRTCHDTVSVGDRLYCSGIAAELIFDTGDLVDEAGKVRGTPLPCEVVDGTETAAKVTDCEITAEERTTREAWEDLGAPQAEGWRYLGHYNHPGPDSSNGNLQVPAERGVAVSHESRPLESNRGEFLVVSDERGGGVVPGGANCTDENFDMFNHGGLHFFDISDPSDISYATKVDDDGTETRAVWRGEVLRPAPTFCVVHRFRQLPGEQRLVMGYYSQGTKILDFTIDDEGRLSFHEIASFIPGSPLNTVANTWTGDVFHIVDNTDGTRTYFFAASDIQRGIDVFSWTGSPHPLQPPLETFELRRLAGPTRIDTAVAISAASYDSAATVVLARADEYADALAGAPLATQLDAPMLLSDGETLSEQTAAEIGRLGARHAVLLGGEAALSQDVQAQLLVRGVTSERIGGANRFATAALIANELEPTAGAFVVEGIHADPERGWPDAVSAAPLAAFLGHPVLLTTQDRLPEETAHALAERQVTTTTVVGGSFAVSATVFDDLSDRGHGPQRVAGANRYETSRATYTVAVGAGASPQTVWLATGRNWPDALVAGAAIGAWGEAFLLIDGQALEGSPSTAGVLHDNTDIIGAVHLLGGRAAISEQVEKEIHSMFEASGTTSDGGGGTDAGNTTLLIALVAVLPLATLGRRLRR